MQDATINLPAACETVLQAEDLLVELNVHWGRICNINQNAQATQQTVNKQVRLIKHLNISVPIFDGTPSKYHAFKTAFSIATERKKAEPEEKMIFLAQHLGPKSAKIIENIPFTKEGYDLALKLLDETYGDAARIRHDIFTQLTKMPPANNDPQSLKDTFDSIEALLRALETHEHVPDKINNDETYRRLFLMKFPRTIVRSLAPPGKTPTLKEARENLRAIIRTEQDIQSLIHPFIATSVGSTSLSIPITSTFLTVLETSDNTRAITKKNHRDQKSTNSSLTHVHRERRNLPVYFVRNRIIPRIAPRTTQPKNKKRYAIRYVHHLSPRGT